MSFLRCILDPFLKWTAPTEAECQAFRKIPHDVRYRVLGHDRMSGRHG